MKPIVHLIFWSGGLDSTYLIQKTLDENPTNCVWTQYIKIKNNESKAKHELKAIKSMSSFFKNKYNDRFHHLGVSYEVDVRQPAMRVGLEQMPIWLSAMVSVTPKEVNKILVGYVMNDCAISYLREICGVIRAYNKICHFPLPIPEFPLSKFSKQDICNFLYDELKHQVVWCESPREDGRPCFRCESCKRSPLLLSEKQCEEEPEFII